MVVKRGVITIKDWQLRQRRSMAGRFPLLAQRYLFAIEKHAMPQFQGHQRKDFLRVRAELAVRTDQLFDGGFLEIPSLDRLSVRQYIPNLISEIISQPEFIRDRKPGLFSF